MHMRHDAVEAAYKGGETLRARQKRVLWFVPEVSTPPAQSHAHAEYQAQAQAHAHAEHQAQAQAQAQP